MEEKLWTKRYILALSIMFGVCMCSNIVLSVLSIFAKNLTGLDTYAGMMVSVFTLSALSVRFVAGKLVDQLGCKKVILGGMILTLIASFLYIYCDEIYSALIYRAMQGLGFGISQTGISTYVTKTCAPSRLMEGVNFASVANSLTSVIGPSIAFVIIGAKYDRFDTLFITAFCIALGAFMLMLISKDVKVDATKQVEDEPNQKIHWLILALPAIILFFNCLSQSAITSFISLYAISLGFTSVGSFFSINAIGMICSRFVMNRLVKRFGAFNMILFNSIAFFISLFLISRVNASWQILLLAFPAGFAMGSVSPIINVFMIQKMPGNKSGIANALFYSSMDIGYAIGSLFWGVLAGIIGYAGLFLVAAIVQVICIVLTVIQIKRFALR